MPASAPRGRGSSPPERARRAAASRERRGISVHRGGETPEFLIDGNEAYGADKRTLPSLEDRGLIRVRHEDVETVRVPEAHIDRVSISGVKSRHVLPEHDAPADPGWRAPVELTEEGHALYR